MANRTIAQQIAVLEARRDALETAITSAAGGISSSSIEGMSMSRTSISAMSAELDKVIKSLQRLYRGGRGFVVDMSQTENSSTPSTDYGDTTLVNA